MKPSPLLLRLIGHCDIPCGIYDPHLAQVSAHTVVRMIDLIKELPKKEGDAASKEHLLSRYTATKEEHAEACKRELRILWGDYFKPEHLAKHPDLHDQFWNAMKVASKGRQTLDRAEAEKLVQATNKIAEIFWSTKNVPTATTTPPYNTNLPMVIPKA